MLVSLSSYSQYPAVKTIGKDSVVIMTLKQGQEINNKFLSLDDSLKTLNKVLFDNKNKFNNLHLQKMKVDSTLLVTSTKLESADNEIRKMNDYFREREKYMWRERREWGAWMVLSMLVTVLVASAH